jgi:predicted flavoprotein YhiN
VTESGLEGGAIYALSPALRDAIDGSGEATLQIALRPDVKREELAQRLAAPRGKQSLSNYLRKTLSLAPVEIALMQEATHGKLGTLSIDALVELINALPVRLIGVAPIARAISTAGGVAFDAIDAQFMLRALPGVFVAGEMLDWEAPTGGYLLQACFATGAAAGRGVVAWLNRRAD